jgi:flagellar biosynthetic protein FliQ
MLPSSELARLASEALSLALWVSAPALIASLVVGVLVAIGSATTQIQEQALSHVPRMAAVAIVLLVAGGWMSTEIARFATELFTALPTLVH